MFDMLIINKNYTDFVEIKNICKSKLEIFLLKNLIIKIAKSKEKDIEKIKECFFKSRALDINSKSLTICNILKLCDFIKLEINNKDNHSLFLYLIEIDSSNKKEIVESWFLDLQC